MTVMYDKKASLLQILDRVEDLRWANQTHVSAMVCVGEGPFSLGKSVFNRVADLPDYIAETMLKLSKSGKEVHPHTSRIILAPGIASFNFNSGSDFLTLMSGLKREPIVCGTAGANLSAQLRGFDKYLVEAYAKFVIGENIKQAKDGQPPIKVVKNEAGDQIDYIFPSINAMRGFCRFVESGAAETYARAQREQEKTMRLCAK
jgi:hypothetical protein